MPQTLIEFFALEAAEYLDKLEGAVQADPAEPDRIRRLARALRGAARMADQEAIGDAAGAFQSVAQALVDGLRSWDSELAADLTRGVDDLRTAIRGLSSGDLRGDEVQARARSVTERLGGVSGPAQARPPEDDEGFYRFIASELKGVATEISNAVGVLERDPQEREPLKTILRRIRPLRGIQAVGDLQPVGAALTAVEDVILQIAELKTAAGPGHLALFRRAREALEESSRALGRGERPARGEGRRAEIEVLKAEVLDSRRPEAEVRSITELYYADAGPHIISSPMAERGAGSLENFFRLEGTGSVDLAERLWTEVAAADREDLQRVVGERLVHAYSDLAGRALSFGRPRLAAVSSRIADTIQQRARGPGWAIKSLASAVAPTLDAFRRAIVASSDEEARPELEEIEHAVETARRETPVVPIDSLQYTPDEALQRALELQEAIRGRLGAGLQAEDLRDDLTELHDLLRISAGQSPRG